MNEEMTESIKILASYFKAGEELCNRICLEWAGEDKLARERVEGCLLQLPALARSSGIDERQTEILSVFSSDEAFPDIVKTENAEKTVVFISTFAHISYLKTMIDEAHEGVPGIAEKNPDSMSIISLFDAVNERLAGFLDRAAKIIEDQEALHVPEMWSNRPDRMERAQKTELLAWPIDAKQFVALARAEPT